MRRLFLIALYIYTGLGQVFGQDSTYAYNINILPVLVHKDVPFWMHSNTYGSVPEKGSFVMGQFSFHRKYNPNNPRFFQWSGGVELITNLGNTNKAFFSDLYIAGKAGPVELAIGQRKEFTGLGDTLLTSGSIALGSNYRPYPKIQLSTPAFFNVIPGSDFLALKFSYSDAILGDAKVQYGNVSHVPEVYFHQKFLYARLGGIRSKFSVYAGFNHQVMWGGEDKIFAGGLKRPTAYDYVIFGKPWLGSRVGNHFGTIDIAAEIKIKAGTILMYRQNIYEDGSLAKLSNVADGLTGLRFKRKSDSKDKSFKINTALLEFVYTMNQGGEVFDFNAGIFGNDNYYNHYVYQQGWSYRGRSLGSPLLSSQSLLTDTFPKDSISFTTNNRIVGLHTGFDISWNSNKILFKGTFTQNSGTYKNPFRNTPNQLSFMLRLEKSVQFLNHSTVYLIAASDIGKLYPSNSGLSVGWTKYGFLGKR